MTPVDVCTTAASTIVEARRAWHRGDGDPLDGHALLAPLKVAAALGILDGRPQVSDEDWELAGLVMAAQSDRTREHVAAELAKQKKEASTARAHEEGQREVIRGQVVEGAHLPDVSGGCP